MMFENHIKARPDCLAIECDARVKPADFETLTALANDKTGTVPLGEPVTFPYERYSIWAMRVEDADFEEGECIRVEVSDRVDFIVSIAIPEGADRDMVARYIKGAIGDYCGQFHPKDELREVGYNKHTVSYVNEEGENVEIE